VKLRLEEMELALPGVVDQEAVEAQEEEEEGLAGMGGNRPGAGPSGDCVCPNCGARVSHQIGTPCYDLSCPKCGSKMIRG